MIILFDAVSPANAFRNVGSGPRAQELVGNLFRGAVDSECVCASLN